MFRLTIPATEQYDEIKEEFIETKEQTIELEHSLVSISKWEAKWCKSFIETKTKTSEESLDYIRCMTITKNVKPEAYSCIRKADIDKLYEYMNAPMTASHLPEKPGAKGGRGRRDVVTSELIYYWMISYGIPLECEKWHLNRLLTLIQIFNAKEGNSPKMSKKDIMSRNAQLNAARRQQYNSRG